MGETSVIYELKWQF